MSINSFSGASFRSLFRADLKKVDIKKAAALIRETAALNYYIIRSNLSGTLNRQPAGVDPCAITPIARATQHTELQAGFLTCTLLFDPFPSI